MNPQNIKPYSVSMMLLKTLHPATVSSLLCEIVTWDTCRPSWQASISGRLSGKARREGTGREVGLWWVEGLRSWYPPKTKVSPQETTALGKQITVAMLGRESLKVRKLTFKFYIYIFLLSFWTKALAPLARPRAQETLDLSIPTFLP